MLTMLCYTLAILCAISLGATLLVVRWTLIRSSMQASEASKDHAATISVISGMLATTLEETTQAQAKTLGSLVATTKESTSGISSVAASLLSQISDLVTLLATKEPMAYSQVRQTQAALGGVEDDGKPYPAVDDAAEEAARERFLSETDAMEQVLRDAGINPQEV